MQANNTDRRQSTQTSKRRKGSSGTQDATIALQITLDCMLFVMLWCDLHPSRWLVSSTMCTAKPGPQ
jgi:hypothetical protein